MGMDECERIIIRSLVDKRVCFGGFPRRTWMYDGLCPWGSMRLVVADASQPFFLRRAFLTQKDKGICYEPTEF
jgi:hypothetical protein